MPNLNRKRDESVNWPRCTKCPHRHHPDAACPPVVVTRGQRQQDTGDAIWLIAPMPPGHWPLDRQLPRDESFRWWVRSHCGHDGGARQWAFYDQRYAIQYRRVFLDDPCRYTRCHDQKRGDDVR